jgi:O-antigen ligase
MHHRPPLRYFLVHLGQPELLKSCTFLLCSALLFLAIVCSFSRMGLISSFASLIILAALILLGSWRAAPHHHVAVFGNSPSARFRALGRARLLFAGLVLTLAGVWWIGMGPVLAHFQRLSRDEFRAGEINQGRLPVWKDTLTLIRQHLWTGVGLGCFEFAYTRVQSTELTFSVDHAHNDYFEFAAELGLPAASLLFALVCWLLFQSLRAAARSQSSMGRALAFGCCAGNAALLVHSIADFNLHIPANALVFAVLLALGYSALLDSPPRPAALRPSFRSRAA